MFPLFMHSTHAPDGLMLLFMAMAVDATLGEMGPLFRILPHPVVLIGRVIGLLDRRLNRPDRSEADRRRRGILVALGLGLGALGLGAIMAFLARTLPHAWLFEVFVAATLLAQRSLFEHVYDVAMALKDSGLEAGRYAVSRIVGRDPQSLDSHGVVRAAIESLAENFGDGVVAPVFWYAILGLPGLLLYKTINTADSMIGHRNDKYRAFGMASARLDDLLNLIPARLAGLLLVLAAPFVPRGRPWSALVTMLRDARHHRSPNSGWPEAAAAGALGLALGGPRKYPGLTVDEKWIGTGRARAEPADIQRALHLYTVACLLQVGLVILALWLQA
ncbi:adenosylcobinamide-phosphate synthase CbiB [Paramagnetospirillum magneticum]|uniref:Cobalamin biosynthesis protein CobD n=1 Tax=Paramagnetospirillum magneticum (strain ATCC 700264 / AMB-1) TaxID=342108 RepID=Q2WAM8_PARM1|nr:adenosylcobinamide-phosphate synthase CbiB [Paramagnetospirillum magneticum]BAE49097.1 Cobalamin biosynthesis protein CobD/CbiB [Paramagnetospirillum magneticum AMB-1]